MPEPSGAALVAGILALHREVPVDTCCSPEVFGKTCKINHRCHECGDSWPCATARMVKRFGDDS